MLRGGGHTWRPGREQNFHAGNIPTPSRTVKFRWREYPDIRPQRVKSWRYRMARQKINVVMPHMHRPTANESILIFYEPFRDAAFFSTRVNLNRVAGPSTLLHTYTFYMGGWLGDTPTRFFLSPRPTPRLSPSTHPPFFFPSNFLSSLHYLPTEILTNAA